MTNPGEPGDPGDHEDPSANGPPDDQDMASLLAALRTVAREDDAAMAGFSGEVPELSVGARAQIVARILASPSAPRPATTAAPMANARGRARRAGRRWAISGVALAAAAAALALWVRPRTPATADPIPAYTVAATGGVAEVRGASPAGAAAAASEGRTARAQRVRPESELQITCRPDLAVAGPVAVRAFFVQDGAVYEAHPDVQVAPSGAVALHLRGVDLPAHHAGRGELRVVVGRPETVHALAGGAAVTPKDEPTASWLVVPLDLDP